MSIKAERWFGKSGPMMSLYAVCDITKAEIRLLTFSKKRGALLVKDMKEICDFCCDYTLSAKENIFYVYTSKAMGYYRRKTAFKLNLGMCYAIKEAKKEIEDFVDGKQSSETINVKEAKNENTALQSEIEKYQQAINEAAGKKRQKQLKKTKRIRKS